MEEEEEAEVDRYRWNVVLDCAVYPMVYRMERIEEEVPAAAAATVAAQQRDPSPAATTQQQQQQQDRSQHTEDAQHEEVGSLVASQASPSFSPTNP